MKLEVSYELVRPSAVSPFTDQLQALRLEGLSGMGMYLQELNQSPAYLEGNSRISLARVDGVLIGWSVVCLTARCVAKFNVFVKEEYRGCGVGSELVRQLTRVYDEIAEVPPTIARQYRGFYLRAAPDLFIRSKIAKLSALR